MAMSNEESTFFEFKEKIKPHLKSDNFLHQDLYLKKWLIARDFNVNKAEKMFIENIKFRKQHDVDNIETNFQPNDILKKYTTGGIIGYDKEHNVLRVELFGKLDMKGLMYSCKKTDMEKMKILECERIVQMWKLWNDNNPGSYSDGLTVIFDMDGVSSQILWRPGLNMYLHLIKIMEDNYPEMLRRLFVINAPAIFPFLWRICRPLVSERTKTKIHVLSGNSSEVLLNYIGAESLPKVFGGEKLDEDGDIRCKSWICQGGKIPSDLYISDMVNMNDAENVHIAAGAQHFIEKEVKIPNSILRWEFQTTDYDIGFGLSLNSDSSEQTIIPVNRTSCHLVPEDGSYLCEEIGKYRIIFDNSYSIARSKSLKIFCELLLPDESFKDEIKI